ncbi:unnamed protein product [Acanthosepion pharaonis]|uniref:Uncharacterized protein n=1 Tax=Acanthosepion pharaonis TaxID=158019 RepID=A0A812DMY1_ACAPH|nr:unnamed protein product [Sepia pharaonis]
MSGDFFVFFSISLPYLKDVSSTFFTNLSNSSPLPARQHHVLLFLIFFSFLSPDTPPFEIIMAQKMNYEDLPIDIHYNKLTEWLISRRHCQQNWPASALAVRDKINGAIKKLPDHEEVTKIIQGSKVNYVHVKKIVEFLSKDTESGKKNLFGQYANEMTKEWSDILKLYEKDNVYLIESAQIMGRNVNYEIPALKRQITRCQQIEKDCQKREEDYVTKAADLRRKYENACKRLGIEGKKVKAELYAQVHELPELLDSLCRHVIAVEEASIYYGDFVNFLMQNENLDKDCVPLIKYIIKNGNTTVYEWRTGKKPISIIDTDLIRNEEEANENNITENQSINWDAAEEIDFGDVEFDMSQITLESAGGKDDEAAIDWGDGEENKPSEETSDEGEDNFHLISLSLFFLSLVYSLSPLFLSCSFSLFLSLLFLFLSFLFLSSFSLSLSSFSFSLSLSPLSLFLSLSLLFVFFSLSPLCLFSLSPLSLFLSLSLSPLCLFLSLSPLCLFSLSLLFVFSLSLSSLSFLSLSPLCLFLSLSPFLSLLSLSLLFSLSPFLSLLFSLSFSLSPFSLSLLFLSLSLSLSSFSLLSLSPLSLSLFLSLLFLFLFSLSPLSLFSFLSLSSFSFSFSLSLLFLFLFFSLSPLSLSLFLSLSSFSFLVKELYNILFIIRISLYQMFVFTDDGIARGDDALTLLESVQTRNLLMEDLMELEFFLTQRLFEIEAPSNSLSTYQFHNAPDSILRTSSEVCTLANTVQAAWQLLNSDRMKHLLQLKRSPKYVDRLEDSLRQNLTQADKMVFREKEMILRKQQAFAEEEEIAPKLEVFKQDTLALKKQVESEISQKYNNRIVNIMGEINTI